LSLDVPKLLKLSKSSPFWPPPPVAFKGSKIHVNNIPMPQINIDWRMYRRNR
jgi:hypothetical protein